MRRDYVYEVGEIVNGIFEIVSKTRHGKGNRKAYEVKSLLHPKAPNFIKVEDGMKRGDGCPYERGLRIYEGNSLYSIEEVKPYLTDVEEAKKVAPKSNKKMMFKCPVCNQEKEMEISKITTRGFSCPKCSTGTSYGEKFILSYLDLKEIEYKYQHREDSLKGRIFDFYLPKNDIYLEVMGEQHYNESSNWYESAKEQDEDKRSWTIENKKTLIELDCRKSEFEFIKSKINESILPNINNNEKSNIKKSIKKWSNISTKDVLTYYKKYRTCAGIDKELDISPTIAYKILRDNNIVTHNKRIKVMCLNNGMVFNSVTEASKYAELIGCSGISRACNGKSEYAGIINGEKLRWKYVD